MQITLTFTDSDLKDPIVKNQLLNWLGVAAQPGGAHPIAEVGSQGLFAHLKKSTSGNGEDLHPEPYVQSETEPSPSQAAAPRKQRQPRVETPPTAAPLGPSAVREPGKRGRMSNAEKAQLASLRAAQDNAPTPTPNSNFPPGVSAQLPPAHVAAAAMTPPGATTPPVAAMPPATPPTGDSLTELNEWARQLDAKQPGGVWRILSDSQFPATAAIPPERVPEFIARFQMALNAL